MSQPKMNRKKTTTTPTIKNPKELLLSVQSVVKNRTGAVLARQLILKSDHFDTALNTRLDFNLLGAPNFRMADLNIFGVAQPVLSLLVVSNCIDCFWNFYNSEFVEFLCQ